MDTDDSFPRHTGKPRRSVLSVPAINLRALDKTRGLDCDAIILDLEDSVAPDVKENARENLRQFFEAAITTGTERIIRINAVGSEFYDADIDLVITCNPEAILLPKVGSATDIHAVITDLENRGARPGLRIWAMIETPQGVLNVATIAAAREAGLECLVVGLNDLRKDTGVADLPGRPFLVPWLMQTVLAARSFGLDVIDSVYNNFRNIEAFEAECVQGKQMGFDGKMLIHPAQIDAANRHFGPDETAIQEAASIVEAFAQPQAASANVINMNGTMVERLHMEQAMRLLAKARAIADRKENRT